MSAGAAWLSDTRIIFSAAGYWLLATGYWLLATGYWLLATGYWLLATATAPVTRRSFVKGGLDHAI
ncbi:hypothetical protein ACHAPF_004770 [Botrytis cinerea]